MRLLLKEGKVIISHHSLGEHLNHANMIIGDRRSSRLDIFLYGSHSFCFFLGGLVVYLFLVGECVCNL